MPTPISSEEDAVLRRFLSDVPSNSNVAFSSLSATETASLLYRSGKKLAAKELLCDQPEVYAAFKRTASPCHSRTDSQLRRDYQAVASATQSTMSAPQTAFRQRDYRSQADCLTAAYTSGASLSSCSGR